jgi:hypothetical protein
MSGVDEKVAGMNVRHQDIVQGDRLVASDRNQGIRRIRRACLNVVGEPGIESGRSHDRRQRRQIDVVLNRREVRNGVGTTRLVEDELIRAAAARERIVVTGAENNILAGRAHQRQL